MLGMELSNFIAGQEWIFIIIIAVVFIFGAKKIPELAKTFGKAKGEFEKGKIEADKDLKEFKEGVSKASKDKEIKSD
ncbi:translocase [Nitrosopumilus sp. b3]|uniref:Sec-independent protein translocase subunit TatA/TatB n=1 Tax=Nitrosopumilus sp. b3 TaxID=2109909 RepID=UPI0015F76AA0|nr:twin-arginine translocase TatA/TatE family subunit [Nitrosopumilus sp. b3]KAF6247632.1 translocase [Nitrosopumilus sp. b3]